MHLVRPVHPARNEAVFFDNRSACSRNNPHGSQGRNPRVPQGRFELRTFFLWADMVKISYSFVLNSYYIWEDTLRWSSRYSAMSTLSDACPFCSDPMIKKRVIAENAHARAFLSNMPIVPGHILVCPVRCVPRFDLLREEEALALLNLSMALKRPLATTLGALGFNYAWNEEQVAGQTVPHLHLHMLPRKLGDTGIHNYEPRKFLYRPGSRATCPESELITVSESIRNSLHLASFNPGKASSYFEDRGGASYGT